MASFKCKDIGMNCGFEVHGAATKDEVMQLAAVHARATHGMESIPSDVAAKIDAAIHL